VIARAILAAFAAEGGGPAPAPGGGRARSHCRISASQPARSRHLDTRHPELTARVGASNSATPTRPNPRRRSLAHALGGGARRAGGRRGRDSRRGRCPLGRGERGPGRPDWRGQAGLGGCAGPSAGDGVVCTVGTGSVCTGPPPRPPNRALRDRLSTSSPTSAHHSLCGAVTIGRRRAPLAAAGKWRRPRLRLLAGVSGAARCRGAAAAARALGVPGRGRRGSGRARARDRRTRRVHRAEGVPPSVITADVRC
jgi:hypothetical protein